MFIRRNKKHPIKKAVDFIYPSIGFKRAFKYMAHRLGRLPATPYQIAGGFACGAAISFTPFIGLHFILSALTAFCLRSSIIASAIGTVVGNPLTFPIIWSLTYKTGLFILGQESKGNISNLFSETISVFGEMNTWYFSLITSPTEAFNNVGQYTKLWGAIWEKIFPLLIGSIPWVIGIWFLFFLILRPLMSAYKKANDDRKAKKNK